DLSAQGTRVTIPVAASVRAPCNTVPSAKLTDTEAPRTRPGPPPMPMPSACIGPAATLIHLLRSTAANPSMSAGAHACAGSPGGRLSTGSLAASWLAAAATVSPLRASAESRASRKSSCGSPACALKLTATQSDDRPGTGIPSRSSWLRTWPRAALIAAGSTSASVAGPAFWKARSAGWPSRRELSRWVSGVALATTVPPPRLATGATYAAPLPCARRRHGPESTGTDPIRYSPRASAVAAKLPETHLRLTVALASGAPVAAVPTIAAVATGLGAGAGLGAGEGAGAGDGSPPVAGTPLPPPPPPQAASNNADRPANAQARARAAALLDRTAIAEILPNSLVGAHPRPGARCLFGRISRRARLAIRRVSTTGARYVMFRIPDATRDNRLTRSGWADRLLVPGAPGRPQSPTCRPGAHGSPGRG